MSAPTARERVELMLSILPWLEARGGAHLGEVAQHFGADAEMLRRDLETVFYDVEPKVGEGMVEVHFDEEDHDFVTVRLPGFFSEPPQLDHEEALKLLAAGAAMVDQPGLDDSLRTALDKLAASLGEGAAEAVQVDLGRADPGILGVVSAAVAGGRSLRITYYSYGRDEVGDRTIDPWALRSVAGKWYLSGHCHESGGLRHFRVDRLLAAEPTGAPLTVPAPADLEEPLAQMRQGGRPVELNMPLEASWVVGAHPVLRWTEEGDRIVAELRIHGEAWLDRLLLTLGSSTTATDLASGESLAPRRAEAARRVLARYPAMGADAAPTVRST